MPSPNLDSLFPLLLPRLPECPLEQVRAAVKQAARAFCRQSTAWRGLLPALNPTAGQREYALTLPADAELVLICNVLGPWGELKARTLEQLAEVLPLWPSAEGSPRYFNSLDDQKLALYPLPTAQDEADAYLPRVALAPTATAADLPNLLTSRYDAALVAGTLAELLARPNRPWSDPEGALLETQRFQAATTAARIHVEHERVRGSLSVRPRSFT